MGVTSFDALNLSADVAITANPGGGQANAYPLTKGINRIAVVAAAGDSVKLPAATVQNLGQLTSMVVVINDTANSAQVFPSAATETINGAASVALAAGKVATYYTAGLGRWFGNLSA